MSGKKSSAAITNFSAEIAYKCKSEVQYEEMKKIFFGEKGLIYLLNGYTNKNISHKDFADNVEAFKKYLIDQHSSFVSSRKPSKKAESKKKGKKQEEPTEEPTEE